MRTTSKIKVTVAAAVALLLAGCGTAASHPTTRVPAELSRPQVTSAAAAIGANGFGGYRLYATITRAELASAALPLYEAGHIDDAATGVSADGTFGELFVIARPGWAQNLADDMRATVDAIDAANPVPSPHRLALVYIPGDPDRAVAGPLNITVIGDLGALNEFMGQWSPNPAALLPPPGN